MRGDHGGALLKNWNENARVRQFWSVIWQTQLPTRVRKQRHLQFRHLRPERFETFLTRIDAVMQRQTFHHDGAALVAAHQFINRIRAGRMNRTRRQNIRMLLANLQHDIIGNIQRALLFNRIAVAIANPILRKQNHVRQRRSVPPFQETL
jgi:hypothetical protein